MATYGYIRVSTRDQNLDRQYDSMHAHGLDDDHIFADKQSGKNFERPEYEKLISILQKGDVVLFHSLDRMGRNYEEMGRQWRIITEDKKAHVKVLDMPMLDTTQNKDITGTLIADIVFKLLSYMAQLERENTLKRQAEGMKAARERGVVFGRKAGPKPAGYERAVEQWEAGEISAREAGRRLGVAHTTFLKWVRE